jgi:Fe-S cluster assembly ATP-binding protein
MLEIKNLTASIGDKQILADVNLSVAPGECLLVTGHNGSGKSTLLHTIMGRPDIAAQGSIEFNDVELTELECHNRARQGVFMFHQTPPTIDGVNTMTLLNEVNKIHNMKYTRGKLIVEANDLFLHLGLPDKWSKRQFNQGASGGERKKNELAVAEMFGGKLLLLDEPDSGLEQQSRQRIVELINRSCSAGKIVLLVTHDQNLQSQYSKNKIELANGRIL